MPRPFQSQVAGENSAQKGIPYPLLTGKQDLNMAYQNSIHVLLAYAHVVQAVVAASCFEPPVIQHGININGTTHRIRGLTKIRGTFLGSQ